ncbi:hypothetical protein HMPREF9120_02060 [Neisseria sp. oral taxon 020 str. F0370]|nr:hypothetical protein HMPREF9120_02060 [Neisseria sp. oral taxon 020 str. F0370]
MDDLHVFLPRQTVFRRPRSAASKARIIRRRRGRLKAQKAV